MKLPFVIIIAVTIFVILIPALFNKIPKKDGYNLIVISATNLRQDHMSLYDYKRNTTPNIDKFAKSAFVFENFFSHASRTVPAGLSLFTSQYPYTHTVWDWSKMEGLDPKTKTFTETLKEHGYKTAAFTGGGQYEGWFGFDRGFDTYVHNKGQYVGFASNLNDALNWLENNKEDKFFLFFQGFDTHCPYFPPQPYDAMFDPDYKNENNIDYSVCYWSYTDTKPVIQKGEKKFPLRKVIKWGGTIVGNSKDDWKEELFSEQDVEHLLALYDGSITYADYQAGKVLDKIEDLGLTKNTIVVILSEHGDLFGKNGRFMRGGHLSGTFYDDVLHVPLIIKVPEVKQGNKINGLAQMIDVAPTILALLGIEKDKEMEGKSLSSMMEGGKEINKYVYAGVEDYRQKGIRIPFHGTTQVDVIRNKDWKLIKETLTDYDTHITTEKYELYNIRDDPKELNNVYSTKPLIANDLKTKLEAWVLEKKKSTNQYEKITPPQQDDEAQKRLIEEGRKRGYY